MNSWTPYIDFACASTILRCLAMNNTNLTELVLCDFCRNQSAGHVGRQSWDLSIWSQLILIFSNQLRRLYVCYGCYAPRYILLDSCERDTHLNIWYRIHDLGSTSSGWVIPPLSLSGLSNRWHLFEQLRRMKITSSRDNPVNPSNM